MKLKKGGRIPMKIREEICKKVCDAAEKLALNTVGRSIPVRFHEPKVPESLRKAAEELSK